MFLLRIEFAGTQPFQIIVTRQCLEPLLQDRRRFHSREDGSDLAVDFQRCRLVAGCLADHHLLDELTYDVDEGLLRPCMTQALAHAFAEAMSSPDMARSTATAHRHAEVFPCAAHFPGKHALDHKPTVRRLTAARQDPIADKSVANAGLDCDLSETLRRRKGGSQCLWRRLLACIPSTNFTLVRPI